MVMLLESSKLRIQLSVHTRASELEVTVNLSTTKAEAKYHQTDEGNVR